MRIWVQIQILLDNVVNDPGIQNWSGILLLRMCSDFLFHLYSDFQADVAR